jgi:hypothetical protein
MNEKELGRRGLDFLFSVLYDRVLMPSKNDEVFNSVVQAITIDMVNMLPSLQFSIQELFHYVSMFPNVFAIHLYLPIWFGLIRFASKGLEFVSVPKRSQTDFGRARARTEGSFILSVGANVIRLPAYFTITRNAFALLGCRPSEKATSGTTISLLCACGHDFLSTIRTAKRSLSSFYSLHSAIIAYDERAVNAL